MQRGGERYLERDSKQASIPLLEMLDLHIQQHKKSMDAAKPTGGLKGPTEAASDGTSPYQVRQQALSLLASGDRCCRAAQAQGRGWHAAVQPRIACNL